MSSFVKRFKTGRFIWTVLVTIYFLIFFTNFFRDAVPDRMALPVLFAYVFVLWLSLEYYFGSPFFQSGVVEHSALWRGVFAFFVYPYLAYLAADYIWWRWTQIPLPVTVAGIFGLIVFGLGTFLRLGTLFDLLRIAQVRPPAKGSKDETVVLPEKKFVGLRFQRLARHPRYFATFVQLVGAALVFRSWGGLLLAFGFGLPLLLLQAKHEDARLRDLLRSELKSYTETVPAFWPRLHRADR
jgi:protein-S-isoprenylcysteine O-methyltransferase Ste14